MRARTTALLVLTGLMPGCAYNGDRLDCGGRDVMLRAVFEYQFENNRSAIGSNAAAYFIGIENEQDPGAEFLRGFDGYEPRVAALSEAARSGHRVIDSQTGKPALIFQIRKVTKSDNRTALIETGYYEAELSASWITLKARCQDEGWLIQTVGAEILS